MEAAAKLAVLKRTYSHSFPDDLAVQVRNWIIGKEYLEGLLGRMESQIEKELQQQSKRDRMINITVIGHGAIAQPFIPSGIHYTSSCVRSVTFYQPWGCMLHSTGAYGIATNCINKDNRQFNLPIIDPATTWNTIPNDTTAVPFVYISPIHYTEQVWQDMTEIVQRHGRNADGIVFEYITTPGAEQLPPFFPLPLLCNIFGMAAAAAAATLNVRVASCLGWDDHYSHALMTQYRSVPAAVMGCNLEQVSTDMDKCEDMDCD